MTKRFLQLNNDTESYVCKKYALALLGFVIWLCSTCISKGYAQDVDNDGVIDIRDLDDDNDGIKDSDEDICVKANADDGIFTGPTTSAITWDFSTGERRPFSLPNVEIGDLFTVNPTSFIRKSGDYFFTINFSNPVPASEIVLIIFDYDRTGSINFEVTSGTATSRDFIARRYNNENLLTYDSNTGELTRTSPTSVVNPSEGIALQGQGNNIVSQITIRTNRLSSGDQIGYFITTPPYCDDDNDGVINSRDLDSDNDGIYDTVEAGGILSSSGSGRAQDDNDNTDNTGNIGIPTSAGSGLVPIATTTGISNHLNIDSDGDRCNDTSEAGFTDDDYDGILGPSPVVVDANGIVTSASDGYTNPNMAYIDDTITTICNTSITINQPIAIDDIINATEASTISVTGTTTGAIAGQPITLTFTDAVSNSVIVNTSVASDGSWIASNIDLTNLNDGIITISGIVVNQFSFTDNDAIQVELDMTDPVVDSFITNNFTPILVGNDKPNMLITILVSEENNTIPIATYSTVTDTDGNWSINTNTIIPASGVFPDLSDNDIIKISATDNAGNTGIGFVTIDITTPEADSFTSPIIKPILTGFGEPNETLTIQISVNSNTTPQATYTLITDSDGVWSIDTNQNVPVSGVFPDVENGDMINVQVNDIAGNTGNGVVLIDTTDSDADGLPDLIEEVEGSDPFDACDPNPAALPNGDCDSDTVFNQFEIGDDPETLQDTDGDTIPDIIDADDDNDDIPTVEENPDPNGDGNPEDAVDSNGNGVPDYLEPNTIDLNAVDGITVYATVSPNGDTFNDVLVIRGIEKFKNKVTIFNRWGVKVFDTQNYGSDHNFFSGIAEDKNVIAQNDGLPSGTYYYTLEYTLDSGVQKKRAGYFYLNR
ncbi:T9SS type B sorting domain-containing protein [Aquimarina algicola]|uniref:Gliding motility-associated C-terminal domain-containing protein n=1 Tax=Aquimarina algicola TaxID=2589995 RepID=A0A504JBG4_9FLAO|nr:gliding motility-associated C-terminal domain-containing protein [Aquimarina algicola]TPN87984.1 hypothetical protein FHK87_10455 [Aquimarina algicola]